MWNIAVNKCLKLLGRSKLGHLKNRTANFKKLEENILWRNVMCIV